MKTKPGVIIFNAECESMCFKHPQGSRHSDNQKSKHPAVQRTSRLFTADRAKEYYRSHKVDERRKRENLPLNISQMFLQSVNITYSSTLNKF